MVGKVPNSTQLSLVQSFGNQTQGRWCEISLFSHIFSATKQSGMSSSFVDFCVL